MQLTVSFFGPIKRPWPEASRDLDIEPGTTLEGLLADLGYSAEDMRRVAMVVNGKKQKLSLALTEGDDVRFVLLAGGG